MYACRVFGEVRSALAYKLVMSTVGWPTALALLAGSRAALSIQLASNIYGHVRVEPVMRSIRRALSLGMISELILQHRFAISGLDLEFHVGHRLISCTTPDLKGMDLSEDNRSRRV